MNINNIKQGTIIKGPNWPEPVEIKFIEEVGEYIHIIGATKNSREHVDQLISKDEFSKFKLDEYKTSFAKEPSNVFLALETTRYRFVSRYDPLLAMNISKVDPLPHQIETVYIMAGLITKEQKIRNLVKQILIVAPGHLRDQWRRELIDRFEEIFIPVGRFYIDSLFGRNVWL